MEGRRTKPTPWRGRDFFVSFPQSGSPWELAYRISWVYHLSGWSSGNDVSVAGGRLRTHDLSFLPTGHPLNSGCCWLFFGSRCFSWLVDWFEGMRQQFLFGF